VSRGAATRIAPVRLHAIDSRLDDVVGTGFHHRFGEFTVRALIPPTPPLVPRRLTATADGEAPKAARRVAASEP